ncbi:MAG: hypothetical protein MAG458_01244 [Nitrosopumilus sp.]|nr:hypothetical protein [Nitrosopumilus sp.]
MTRQIICRYTTNSKKQTWRFHIQNSMKQNIPIDVRGTKDRFIPKYKAMNKKNMVYNSIKNTIEIRFCQINGGSDNGKLSFDSALCNIKRQF